MRWISFLISLTICPLFAGTPTEAVLEVLGNLNSEKRQSGVPEEIALSSFAGPKTRAAINEAWNQRASWIQTESIEFFEGYEKIDNELSAVLVGARSSENPDEVEMMAFGARLEDGEWKVGPVEGRFASMGLGFGKTIRERVRNLEQWMASERVTAADRLKRETMIRFKEKMAKLVDPELLEKASPRQVMERFLDAAKNNRVDEMLVWQGILEREDHDEIPWDELIHITRQGMKNKDARNVWRVLNRPGVMKVLLSGEEDEDEKSMVVSFLAGFKTGRDNKKLRPVVFTVRNTPAGWRLDLPSYFAKANDDDWNHWKAHQREVHFRDEANPERMASVFEEENEPKRAGSPEKLMARVAEDLFEGEIEKSLVYLYRDPPVEEKPEEEVVEEKAEDEEEDEKADPDDVLIQEDEVDPDIEKVGRYREMAIWWTKVSENKKGVRVGAQKVFRSGDLALGVLELLPSDGGWMPQYHPLWMAKDEEGWMIIPGVEKPLEGILSEKQAEDRIKLSKQANAQKETAEDLYLKKLFGSVSVAKKEGKAVTEEAALDLVKKWRGLIMAGNIPEILSLSSVRKIPENPNEILRNLSFQVKGAAAAKMPDRFFDTHAEGRLRGVSIMVDGGRGISMDCPLLIIVSTNDGPKVLIDTELYLVTNKGKEIRNKNELDRLKKEMNKEDFESLKKLVEWHEKTARPAWDEWNGVIKAQQRN